MLIPTLMHHELPPWRFLGSIGLKMGEILTSIEFLEGKETDCIVSFRVALVIVGFDYPLHSLLLV